jgi:hypothetical protein
MHGLYESIALFVDEAGYDPDGAMSPDDLAHVRLTLDVLGDALPRIEGIAGEGQGASCEHHGKPMYDRYLAAGGASID